MDQSVKFSDGAASRSPLEMPPALLTLPADSNPARLDQRRQLPDVHPVVDGLRFRRHPVHRCIPHHGFEPIFEPVLPLEGRFPERGFMRASREQHLRPQCLERITAPHPVHYPDHAVQAFGEGIGDPVTEVIEDVGLSGFAQLRNVLDPPLQEEALLNGQIALPLSEQIRILFGARRLFAQDIPGFPAAIERTPEFVDRLIAHASDVELVHHHDGLGQHGMHARVRHFFAQVIVFELYECSKLSLQRDF